LAFNLEFPSISGIISDKISRPARVGISEAATPMSVYQSRRKGCAR
jgi:hypothetical protein